MMHGKRAGRANWLIVSGILGLVVAVVLVFFSGEAPETAGTRFMTALATGDVNTLVKMSHAEGIPEQELRDQWTFATQVAAPHYRFVYRVTSGVQADANTASVRMSVVRNAERPTSYEEKFELPLVKVNGQWKVDILSLDRRLYPALPR